MARFLIVGFGNPMRSDDGVGWHVTRGLSDSLRGNDVEVIAAHQLTPEMAERVSKVEHVLFIDASGEGPAGTVKCTAVGTDSAANSSFHELSPAAVLKLASQLYGNCPTAHLLTIGGENFETGNSLSPKVVAAVPEVLEIIEDLMLLR